MNSVPDAAQLRADLAALPVLDRKVVGGLTILLISEPGNVRNREWLAERFVQLAVVAHGFGEASSSDAAVATIESYAKERMGELVGRSLAVFVRVAEDLKAAQAGPPYGLDEAFTKVKDYVGEIDLEPPAGD